MKTLGPQIKRWRFHHHILQEDLATLLGVTPKVMQAIESGHLKPKGSIIDKMRSILDRSKLTKQLSYSEAQFNTQFLKHEDEV